jgi:protein-arginine kinase
MTQIRDYVRDYGGGLMMLGGEESFGLGGYYRTPIEEALPVTMEVKQKVEIPSLAVVLSIDRSGSMAMSTDEKVTKLDIDPRLAYVNLPALGQLDRQVLVERQLISRELADAAGPVGPKETVSLMVNEEDHIRLQVMRSGFALDEVWQDVDKVDDLIEQRITYAFSEEFGYLTACPTNVGTGMRASVMLHLPALDATKQIEKVFRALQKINLAVRGLYGEGSRASGDFYQISNQDKITPDHYGQIVTLNGKTDGDTITIDSLKM